eukprot:Rhum_TRINITY_DN22785_c0_g1::Rhum_TRINITY_DN22785_c0_g1_i1::g.176040::m.176040
MGGTVRKEPTVCCCCCRCCCILQLRLRGDGGGDDLGELGLRGGTADEEAVDGRLRPQRLRVLRVDGAAVDDAHLLRHRVSGEGRQVRARVLAHLLRLLRRRHLAGADRPDRLVRDDDLVEGRRGKTPEAGGELGGADLLGAAGLTLGQGLADAEDDGEVVLQGSLDLLADDGVGLLVDGATLAVAEDDVVEADVLHLLGADLSGERTALHDTVLRRQLDVSAGHGLDRAQVQRAGGQDDLSLLRVRRGDGAVEGLDETGEARGRARALEVASDERGPRHFNGVCVCVGVWEDTKEYNEVQIL